MQDGLERRGEDSFFGGRIRYVYHFRELNKQVSNENADWVVEVNKSRASDSDSTVCVCFSLGTPEHRVLSPGKKKFFFS